MISGEGPDILLTKIINNSQNVGNTASTINPGQYAFSFVPNNTGIPKKPAPTNNTGTPQTPGGPSMDVTHPPTHVTAPSNPTTPLSSNNQSQPQQSQQSQQTQ
jgi:hypothetical protein